METQKNLKIRSRVILGRKDIKFFHSLDFIQLVCSRCIGVVKLHFIRIGCNELIFSVTFLMQYNLFRYSNVISRL